MMGSRTPPDIKPRLHVRPQGDLVAASELNPRSMEFQPQQHTTGQEVTSMQGQNTTEQYQGHPYPSHYAGVTGNSVQGVMTSTVPGNYITYATAYPASQVQWTPAYAPAQTGYHQQHHGAINQQWHWHQWQLHQQQQLQLLQQQQQAAQNHTGESTAYHQLTFATQEQAMEYQQANPIQTQANPIQINDQAAPVPAQPN